MKISSFLSIYYVWILIFLQFNLYVQGQTSNLTTIYLEKAGELSKHISLNEKYKITNLTIVGYLNRDDFDFLKDMAGNSERINDFTEQNASQYKTDGKLSVLNLLDTKIQFPQDICFSHCLSLTSIILPKDLPYIDDGAFFRCSNLKNIEMNNIYKIGWNAFYECSKLTNPTIIPNSVSVIEPGAFYKCTGFSKIVLPDNVIFEENVFKSCCNIKEFIVAQQNMNYTTIDGVLLSKDLQTLIAYPLGKAKIIFPNNVITIGKGAFFGCINTTNITIPNSVEKISEGAFQNCENLTALKISNSVKSIDPFAFYGCLKLKKIYIDNSIPPLVYTDSFGSFFIYEFDKSTCDLYIPKGTYNAYWFEPCWREFNIVETNFATANENIAINKQAEIYSKNGNIVIDTNKRTLVAVFNVEGKLICNFETTRNQSLPVKKGVYIVKLDNCYTKIKVE
mgnify:FL=1